MCYSLPLTFPLVPKISGLGVMYLVGRHLGTRIAYEVVVGVSWMLGVGTASIPSRPCDPFCDALEVEWSHW